MAAFLPRLILFDIDGTLLKGRRRLRAWFKESLEAVYGSAGNIDGHSFSGKTDPQIVAELMSGAGLPADLVARRLPRLKEVYLRRLEEELEVTDLELLPEVRALLARLEEIEEVTVGLLTGNWEGGARCKLSRLGLNRFFEFGAFGDDRADRTDLPPVALRRAARARGRSFTARETLIVGDSPLDVACARAHGIRAAAVTTGYTGLDQLEASGADWILSDLGEIGRIHPALGSRS